MYLVKLQETVKVYVLMIIITLYLEFRTSVTYILTHGSPF